MTEIMALSQKPIIILAGVLLVILFLIILFKDNKKLGRYIIGVILFAGLMVAAFFMLRYMSSALVRR